MERLTNADARFLDLEDQVSAMHNVTAAIFEGPEPPFSQLEARVAERVANVPRLRQRVVAVPFEVARPVWIDDPQFSLDYHVRHSGLPARATMDDFRNLVGRLLSQRLDRGKPLWELWMVSRLPRRRWAIVSKAHYSMVDGVSGADPLSLVTDQARARCEEDRWAPEAQPTESALLAQALSELAFDPVAQMRLARRKLSQSLVPLGGLLRRPGPDRHAGLVGTVGPHRRWQEVEVEAEPIRALRDSLDVATNDVVLGLVAWGFRAMLLAAGVEPPDSIRTLAPLAVATGDHFTNEVSALEADLPVGLDDVGRMIRRISDQTERAAGRRKAVAGATLADLPGLMAPTLCSLGLRSAAESGARMGDVQTVTVNAPGPRDPVTVLGKPMAVLLPAIPLVARVRVVVGVMSYRDRFGFGITGDRDAGMEIAALAGGIESAVSQAARQSR